MSESRGTGRGRREPKSRRARIQMVVLHSDPGTSDGYGDGDEELSARFPSHYYVDAAGRVAALRPETTVLQHIGNAQWRGRNRNIDRISIGVAVAQTPGAPYSDEQINALRELLAAIFGRYGLDEEAVFRWEPDITGQEQGRGVLVPMRLPIAILPHQDGSGLAHRPRQAASAAPVAEPEEVEAEADIQCEPPPETIAILTLPQAAAPTMAQAAAAFTASERLWAFLQGETYRQRGDPFNEQWAMHQVASAHNLGAPLAISSPEARRIRFDNRTYHYQPYARDIIYNEVPLWGEVRKLRDQLSATIPASGLPRLLLEAGYQDSGGALHAGWSMHREAVRLGLGAPLGSSYRITVDGQRFAIQVFACDTLYTPIANPEPATDWDDVRLLSGVSAGALREQLWAETYKPCGSAYQPTSPFHQRAAADRLGAPLSDVYSAEFEGTPYQVQVFALDTLYAGLDSVIRRQSELSKPAFTQPVVAFDPVGQQIPTFDRLPLAGVRPSAPRISHMFGFTRFAKLHQHDLYSRTQGKHSGIDFAVPVGTPLMSIGRGLVVSDGGAPFGAGPESIIVRYGGVYALYGHVSAVSVRKGQIVEPGQVLGRSGFPSAPHLHFEIRPVPASHLGNRNLNQTVVNPLRAFNPVGFFIPEIKSYFAFQLANVLGGAQRHYCQGSLDNQTDIQSGGPIDTRACQP